MQAAGTFNVSELTRSLSRLAINCEIGQDFGHRLRSGTNAIRHPDSAVSVTGECQSRHRRKKLPHAFNSLVVANAVLGHRLFPFVNSHEERLRADSKNLLEFMADNTLDFIFGILQDALVARTSQKTANQ